MKRKVVIFFILVSFILSFSPSYTYAGTETPGVDSEFMIEENEETQTDVSDSKYEEIQADEFNYEQDEVRAESEPGNTAEEIRAESEPGNTAEEIRAESEPDNAVEEIQPEDKADYMGNEHLLAAFKKQTDDPVKIAFFGDSITRGRDGSTASDVVAVPYVSYIDTYWNAECDNYSISGIGWMKRSHKMYAYDMIAAEDISQYDYIVLALGVNDRYLVEDVFGTYDEKPGSRTVMGQFHKTIHYIKKNNPTAQIIMIAPWRHLKGGSNDVTGMMRYGAKYYNIPFITQDDNPLVVKGLSKEVLPDRIHPTQEAYYEIGEWLGNKLEKLIGLEKHYLSISSAKLKYSSMVYTGTKRTQSNKTKVYSNEGFKTLLERHKDYKLKYSDNINAGTATLTITGTGHYKGKIVKHFQITPLDLKTCGKITLKYSEMEYTGKKRTQSSGTVVTAATNKGVVRLVRHKDYKITYKNNIYPGKATVTITGIGNYTGKLKATFRIKEAPALEGISFSESQINIAKGKTKQLSVIQTPARAILPTITWSSSNTKIVNVDSNGLIMAKKRGKAKITASCQGFTASCSVKVNPKGMITLIDDDGKKVFKEKLMPIALEKGVSFSTAVIPSRTAKKSYMSWNEVAEVNAAGMEVLCHTYHHFSRDEYEEMTEEEILQEYLLSRKTFSQKGYDTAAFILIYPGSSGKMKKTRKVAAKVFDYAINCNGEKLATDETDPVFIQRFPLQKYLHDGDFDRIYDMIDKVEQEGGWLVWVMHCYYKIVDRTALDNLRTTIDYALARDVDIVSAKRAANILFNAGN